MKLSTLKIHNIRNLEHVEITLDPKLNLFFGDNGQGKTSVLEAAGYLGLLRSFRGAVNEEMILRRSAHDDHSTQSLGSSRIQAVIENEDIDAKLEVQFDPETHSRTAFINDKPYRSSSQYLKQRFGTYEMGFHAVVFAPSDHELIRGEPKLRRDYLDRAIGAERPEHLDEVVRYQKALSQKNAYLKQEGHRPVEILETLNLILSEVGGRIVATRLNWLRRTQKLLASISRDISQSRSSLELHYLSKWMEPGSDQVESQTEPLDQGASAEEGARLGKELCDRMQKGATKELASGSALYGPHRDDFGFWLAGMPVQGHGSQGEVRSALLALKLTEISLFQTATSHRPVLLIDDFSSELDRHRRAQLLRLLEETELQVLVSSTEDVFSFGRKFEVKNGSVFAQ